MSDSTHNTSVEIIDVIKATRGLSDRELQFPPDEIWGGPLKTRGSWMEKRGEYWCYSVEPTEVEGVTAIKLESWLWARPSHTLLFDYGRVFRTIINWDGWTVMTDVIATHQMIPVEDMPRVLEVGKGTAFVVSIKAWEAYKKLAAEPLDRGQVSAGAKLLYHCLINKDLMGEDFTVERFSEWPASMILDLMCRRLPGEKYRTFSPIEAGLLEDPEKALKEAIREARRGANQECLLAEGEERGGVEAEPSKNKALHFVFPDVGSSPPLTPRSKRNDVDELPRRKRKNKGRGPRAPGSKPRRWRKKAPASPLQLTIEQERGIVRLLVLGINPKATEEEIKANQDAVAKRPEGVPEEKPGPYQYGAEPGLWNLSREEVEETLREVSGSPRSTVVLSPRGELSQVINSSVEGISPSPKRMRKSTGVESEDSVPMSPFLSMHSSGGKVISISSSSSPTSEDDGGKRTRVNLGDLLGSGRIKWPENGVFAQIQVEMREDEEEEESDVLDEDGEYDQEGPEVVQGQDQALEDEPMSADRA